MWGTRAQTAAAAYIGIAIACAPVAFLAPPALAEDRCPSVFRELERELLDTSDRGVLRRLAPYASVDAVKKLIARAPASDDALAADLFIAIGASRHAEALRLLHQSPPLSSTPKRLGRALAFLALGDGVETGTIARVLIEGVVADRRRVARTLADMRQKRPRLMLYDALDDPDEQVRLSASRALFEFEDDHARRVLLDLFRGGSSDVQRRAARALSADGYVFKPEELGLLLPPFRTAVIVADAANGRRSNLKLLGTQTRSSDDATRAIAFAALALLGPESKAMLKRLGAKPGEPAWPETAMALALSSEPSAVKALEGLDRAGASRAAAVLWGFSSAASSRSQLEPDHAAQIARAVEGWIVRGLLDDEEAARLLRAMDRCDSASGLILARTRLLGPEGRALTAAIRLIARNARPVDLPDVIAVAPRVGPAARAELWRAAARICLRGR